ncbi:MAG: hypothetical protein Q8Q67_02885 [bacterium]|nr:hypothetical protein [bacterium]
MPVIKKKRTTAAKDKTAASLATFLERPLPDSDEVSRFEDAVLKEARSDEVEENLSAIYHDGDGQLVDVTKVQQKKRLKLITFFKQVVVLTIIACGVYGVYLYSQKPAGAEVIELNVIAPERAMVGEMIAYRLEYRNDSGMQLSDVKLEAILPSSFVLADSSPEPSGVNSWQLGDLAENASGSVTINGYLVAPTDSPNVLVARLTYTPANFSSGFKKEASANTVISALGFSVTVDYSNTALLGQANEFKLNLNGFKSNLLESFYLDVSGSDNLSISRVGDNATSSVTSGETAGPKVETAGEGRWQISGLESNSEERFSVPILFKLNEKNEAKEDLRLRFFKKEADGSERIFWERTISFDVMKSDLNLNLTLNGEKTDQALDYGSELNYSLAYSNNGDATLYDLVLMVVVKGDAVSWKGLKDPSGGSLTGNAILWTKEDISALAEVAPAAKGTIDFSLKVKEFTNNSIAESAEIVSYAQYGLNNNQGDGSDDNKSNTIKGLLNSNLSLAEKIMYFNDDNIPVGSGPLPPRVGEQTSVRVYWTVKNNLHDLQDTEAHMRLPLGVEWVGSNHTNVGTLSYDPQTREVKWRLGYLPTNVYRADAEFSISITPTESDRNKILVLSPGSTITAIDAVTKANLSRQTTAKTTKLEDDEIAGLSNNGRVE